MKIFLDLDGVLVDFVSGIHEVFDEQYKYGDPLEWNFFKKFGVTFDIVNEACCVDFWADLHWMHDGRLILDEVQRKFGEIYLLTTPMPNPGSGTGKLLWIKEYIPDLYKRTILSYASKSLLAGPDTLLIDDKDENIAEFVAAGGCGILVPRPWNELHGWADETLQVVKNSLEDF